MMNKEYAGNIEKIEHTLPTRASNKGSTPTMAGVGPKWNPSSVTSLGGVTTIKN